MSRQRLWTAVFGCFLLASPAISVVPVNEFFPFGLEHGDTAVPPVDDTFAGPITLKHPFSFFNVSHNTLFVNNNGAISFMQGVSQYTATCGALPANLKMIAPYWADINNGQGLGGAVYYRESTDRGLLQKAAREIQAAFPNLWGLSIGWLFISTWYESPFFGATGCHRPGSASIPRNTFQSILATDGRRSFAIFYYNKITWTTGTASGGDKCTGLGGQRAKAGFDVGDGKTFFTVPGSCTADIVNVDDQSNIGSPGKFIFRIDNTFESTTCDSEKYRSERLQINPSFVTVFGQVPITLKGPCLNSSMTITCKFNDPAQAAVHVPASMQTINGTPSALCVVPHLYTYGRIKVDMIMKYRESQTIYSGYIYITEPEEEVKVDVEVTDDGEWAFTLNWDPTYFPQPTGKLSLLLFEYEPNSKTWAERGVLADNIDNNGHATVLAQQLEITSFVSLSLRMRHRQLTKDLSYLGDFFKGAAARLLCAEALLTFDNDAACRAWFNEDNGPPRDVQPCPPLLEQAVQDERFEPDGSTGAALDYFHPGAEFSFRQRTPSASGSGQQCTYKDGRLLLGPLGGGTADMVSPAKSQFEHWRRDVVPWCQCCAYSERAESCRLYYKKRPSDNGNNYIPPIVALGKGDPHITTFDLTSYTFNGVGEFWMIKSDSFSMQARMEQYIDERGVLTPASVFTAFVMKDTTAIQVQLSQSNGLDVLLDGELIVFDNTKKHRILYTSTATITASDDLTKVTVSLVSGFSFTFTTVDNSLNVMASANDANKGKTRGLLGVFDGNPDNDLESPEGTVVAPSASLDTIHYNFGLKWMIKSQESLFTYPKGKSYADYSAPSFVPNFVIPDINTLPQHIRDLCQNSVDCFYDYATTGSATLAAHTRQLEQQFNESVETLTQIVEMCPPVTDPEHGFLNMTSLFVGARITFACNEPYLLVGRQVLTCLNDKQWDDEAPVCVDCRKEGDLLPDPRDCGRFFHCSHGIPYSKKCPSILHFNPVLLVCDWPQKAGCTG